MESEPGRKLGKDGMITYSDATSSSAPLPEGVTVPAATARAFSVPPQARILSVSAAASFSGRERRPTSLTAASTFSSCKWVWMRRFSVRRRRSLNSRERSEGPTS